MGCDLVVCAKNDTVCSGLKFNGFYARMGSADDIYTSLGDFEMLG